MDNDITVYMHGGNILKGLFGDCNEEYFELYRMSDEGANYTSEHYHINWDHVDRLEFTGKRRAKTGFEFIGLEY